MRQSALSPTTIQQCDYSTVRRFGPPIRRYMVRLTPNGARHITEALTVISMSALPPKADMCSATRDVRFGPEADTKS
jgi:hypothetical protein